MINKSLKFGFLILLFSVLFGNYSNAQTPVCNLQLYVFDLKVEQPTKPIESVKAVLTDLATKKTNESTDLNQIPSFTNLASGKYKIEVIKDGYQRRIKELEIDCRKAEKVLTISKVLYLQKGDVKEITKFGSIAFTAKEISQEYKGKSKAVTLKQPKYPAAARAVKASGAVQVQVTLDQDGEVVTADAISGHPLLRQAAEMAAKESRFAPTLLKNQPVIVTGIIVYNFVP